MAFPHGLGDRIDDMRFRNPQSPRDEAPFPTYSSPLRSIGSQLPSQTTAVGDARQSLVRRFTTNTVPTLPTLSTMSPLSPIGQQRKQAAESSDLSSLEKKKLEYEYLREQRRRFQTEMDILDLEAENHKDEMLRLTDEVSNNNNNRYTLPGAQSEPTTPPEYREASFPQETGFPTALSRPNRYSSASLTSPPGLANPNRVSRSGSQVMQPGFQHNQQTSSHKPTMSVPSTRRNSDGEEDEDFSLEMPKVHRPGAVVNRKSMPASGYDYDFRSAKDHHTDAGVANITDTFDTTGFLFKDDKDHMESGKDTFPVLNRNNGRLSTSHVALDLAQDPAEAMGNANGNALNSHSAGWSSFHRHRQGQQSLPMNTLRNMTLEDFEGHFNTPTKAPNPNRHSMDVQLTPFGETKRSSFLASPPNGLASGVPPKLQSSYSTNDIPTLKNTGATAGFNNTTATPRTHAEQHLQNHIASTGRVPPNAIHRHSRELSNADQRGEEVNLPFRPMQSLLQANATPFGPNAPSTTSGAQKDDAAMTSAFSPPSVPSFATSGTGPGPAFYHGYSMPTAGADEVNGLGMNNNGGFGMQSNPQSPPVWNNASQALQLYGQPQQQVAQYNPYGSNQPLRDSQARVIRERRMQNEGENQRIQDQFNNITSLAGHVYNLCKDQHGCRFLQKKLEEHNEDVTYIIFQETQHYVVELMTDPFGNYLCQKLLEFTNDDQRTALVHNAAPEMVKIALNQHGTRALQKMIEFISTPEQIGMVIQALNTNVVSLIQDLNGNHVIQKCLNHLKDQDIQFILDAVAEQCVTVGTHRHGCCVIQRCIDHANGEQKDQLIAEITNKAFVLVQDPFGNYVVQYILDLPNRQYTAPVCNMFRGSICSLSKQKFSSNVMEKCIRVADDDIKRMMIHELMQPNEIEKLIKDNYANYVIQTAMEHAPADTKLQLHDAIRPILPQIRGTPCGRRLMSKLLAADGTRGHYSRPSSGQITPTDSSPINQNSIPLSSYRPGHGHSHSQGQNGFQSPSTNNFSPVGGYNGFANNGYPGGGFQNYGMGNMGMGMNGMGMNGMNHMNGMNNMNGSGMNPMNPMNGMHNMNGMGGMNNMNGANGMNGMHNMNGANGMNGMHNMNAANGMNGMNGMPNMNMNGANGMSPMGGMNGMNNMNGMAGGMNGGGYPSNGFNSNMASPTPHRMSNPPMPSNMQQNVNQQSPYPQYRGAQQPNGGFF
ncbi:hypothetical protein K402DRAFT_417356 [Aulographum hederae CBS 113979]|uniref:PUM-HD domain-containing protein n=1 Tax=Aulographum hederae CBS 113979 TaxID=1176131 RepID=A0A6G1HCA4_9PEZI|nr:hypothetical protein K402DRAFT_417356 [Aulographum hederae CBS 113979]